FRRAASIPPEALDGFRRAASIPPEALDGFRRAASIPPEALDGFRRAASIPPETQRQLGEMTALLNSPDIKQMLDAAWKHDDEMRRSDDVSDEGEIDAEDDDGTAPKS
ncbi:hypothetical protein ACWEK5_27980, partial [Rhodococcus koreensis]